MWPSFDQSEQVRRVRGETVKIWASVTPLKFTTQSLLTDNLASEVDQDMITMNLHVVN